MKFLNETELVGGVIGDLFDKAGDKIKNESYELFVAFMVGLGTVCLYISITIIVIGFFCVIINYKKPLKVGLISFLISLILIVMGGSL